MKEKLKRTMRVVRYAGTTRGKGSGGKKFSWTGNFKFIYIEEECEELQHSVLAVFNLFIEIAMTKDTTSVLVDKTKESN